jgi:hypothetical protein
MDKSEINEKIQKQRERRLHQSPAEILADKACKELDELHLEKLDRERLIKAKEK